MHRGCAARQGNKVEWYEWFFDGIGVLLVSGLGAWWFRRLRRRRATAPKERGLIDGDVADGSKLNDIRMRGADYMIKGNVSQSKISRVDFE